MANIFETAAAKIRQTKIVIWIFFAATGMMLIGANHFWEDTLSSLYGLKMIEEAFGMRPVTYDITYWTMAFAPQVAQVIFFYLFMNNSKTNRWALIVALFALFVDFFADTWYRSDGSVFSHPANFFTSVSLTFVYFTVGSELFITVGLGLFMELLGPALNQVIIFWNDFVDAITPNSGGSGRPGGSPPMPRGKQGGMPQIPKGGRPGGIPGKPPVNFMIDDDD